jgi:hypothetical protein
MLACTKTQKFYNFLSDKFLEAKKIKFDVPLKTYRSPSNLLGHPRKNAGSPG